MGGLAERDQEKSNWRELYEIEQGRYHNSLLYLFSHLKYYYTIIAAVLVGTFWVWKEFPDNLVGACLVAFGGLAVLFFAKIGLVLVESAYRHWLETITTLAKYEEKLGHHQARTSAILWPKESLSFPRYHQELYRWSSSLEYVECKMKQGTMKWMRRGFWAIMLLGVLVAAYGGYLIIRNS